MSNLVFEIRDDLISYCSIPPIILKTKEVDTLENKQLIALKYKGRFPFIPQKECHARSEA